MSNALENLPPEMQARLAQIMAGAQATGQAVIPTEPVAPVVQRPLAPPAPAREVIIKPPSLMDHLIALRGEVAEMRNEIANLSSQVTANSNVVEAVGQATGQLYQMFQQSPQQNASSETFSQGFSQSVDNADY
jgi:hypothetical protein